MLKLECKCRKWISDSFLDIDIKVVCSVKSGKELMVKENKIKKNGPFDCHHDECSGNSISR